MQKVHISSFEVGGNLGRYTHAEAIQCADMLEKLSRQGVCECREDEKDIPLDEC